MVARRRNRRGQSTPSGQGTVGWIRPICLPVGCAVQRRRRRTPEDEPPGSPRVWPRVTSFNEEIARSRLACHRLPTAHRSPLATASRRFKKSGRATPSRPRCGGLRRSGSFSRGWRSNRSMHIEAARRRQAGSSRGHGQEQLHALTRSQIGPIGAMEIERPARSRPAQTCPSRSPPPADRRACLGAPQRLPVTPASCHPTSRRSALRCSGSPPLPLLPRPAPRARPPLFSSCFGGTACPA